ncbi:hypothetical protein [Fimbriiglobus ruber]|uniref:Uncharacterized protein n=1 Tax=Fimbriiglobus ruber TaxID=1908690 RepID=A0A225E258_9BACT|nr:hypothetical protein [Fimbriiglobus ruber]OWK47323.1 hypothetical protein FRUB_01022 [Fimbriiglobus ruber]
MNLFLCGALMVGCFVASGVGLLLVGCGFAGGVYLMKESQDGTTGVGEWVRKRLQG